MDDAFGKALLCGVELTVREPFIQDIADIKATARGPSEGDAAGVFWDVTLTTSLLRHPRARGHS